MTGISSDPLGRQDHVTIAYEAATGAQLWLARLGQTGGARALTLSPDGARVYVTGGTGKFQTVAYDAATGTPVWAAIHGTPGNADLGFSLAASPDGTRPFVAGVSNGTPTEHVTLAYDSAHGALLWERRYRGNCCNATPSVKVAPDGAQVFVAGDTDKVDPAGDYITLAYDAATGATIWSRRYNGPGNQNDATTSLAVAPDGTRLFVTGQSVGTHGFDYATIAYQTK